jgi:hypothetical protein
MKNTEIDFYSEFEGEDEIVFFIKTGEYTKELRMWHRYLDMILMRIEVPEYEPWTSLAYYYHLMLGWEIEKNWQIPNLEEALLQLQSIKIEVDETKKQRYDNAEYRILSEMINIISEAICKKIPVYINKID